MKCIPINKRLMLAVVIAFRLAKVLSLHTDVKSQNGRRNIFKVRITTSAPQETLPLKQIRTKH